MCVVSTGGYTARVNAHVPPPSVTFGDTASIGARLASAPPAVSNTPGELRSLVAERLAGRTLTGRGVLAELQSVFTADGKTQGVYWPMAVAALSTSVTWWLETLVDDDAALRSAYTDAASLVPDARG